MKIKLYQLEKSLKLFIAVFVIVLSVGVIMGLTYLSQTTKYSPNKAIERFKGSQVNKNVDVLEIPDSYPKPISEMLITTHNHIIGFSLILFAVGFIFYFNSIISGSLKLFLMIEPLISTIITFGSIWGMRYLSEVFVYFAAISSILLYLSLFTMVVIILFELLFKKAE
ncbi:MAG: hypothetical protein COW08_07455 [Ignavibacteriales bacterium CG12_big_fil_rev_8_21_14_0_65_30_8]|nr:MAG: hypothetical protein COW08_07455 [Ignavibacteriales bacterium CG12_big_fil_rev_8_21_14_0_65_30_8]